MFRTVRLVLACVAGAALLVPLAASAASGRGSGARYCPRYDAYQLHDCRAAPRLPDGYEVVIVEALPGGAAWLQAIALAYPHAHVISSTGAVRPALAA